MKAPRVLIPRWRRQRFMAIKLTVLADYKYTQCHILAVTHAANGEKESEIIDYDSC